jgi:hypothetical protein
MYTITQFNCEFYRVNDGMILRRRFQADCSPNDNAGSKHRQIQNKVLTYLGHKNKILGVLIILLSLILHCQEKILASQRFLKKEAFIMFHRYVDLGKGINF